MQYPLGLIRPADDGQILWCVGDIMTLSRKAAEAFYREVRRTGTRLGWLCLSVLAVAVGANAQPTDPSVWDITGAGDPNLQGFATQIGVNLGETVHFKIKTDSTAYHLDIYRMGYYGGMGASLITTVLPSVPLPQTQPACLTDAATGLIDCGNWAESASWTVPSTAKSGIYFARATRNSDVTQASHIMFVVRNDASLSDIIFQASDTTWQAYNQYGGNSLYVGGPATNPNRAYKVSYNRPITTRSTTPEDFVFNAEYPMVRWLEANGYDVTYTTDVDSDRNGALIKNHKIFLSVGHDEYWSGAQRANVQAARDIGVNLAFFSGNEVFWKTRWENSISSGAAPYRTLVCYKETHASAVIDPADPPTWTGTWRDPRFSPPADGGRPENALTGTIYRANGFPGLAITVPAEDGKMRFWRNTGLNTLAPGSSATLTAGTLQYEFDAEEDNGFRPAGLMHLSTTTSAVTVLLTDYGHTFGSGTVTHSTTLYRAPSGALVFGGGSVQWTWGLDGTHDRISAGGAGPADPRMQQAIVNLFADMGVQPTTLQPGLTAATKSTDATPPSSTITSPASGSTVPIYANMTMSGTASDVGGAVAAVEVSTDGGLTWHPATGRGAWTYAFKTGAAGTTMTLKSRAIDDSGNIQGTPTSISVTVNGYLPCPCDTWTPSNTPFVPEDHDASALELGVKFRSDFTGFVTGVRFYKGPDNTGTHVGHLWSSAGVLLGSVTFTNETASGWQQANFASPIAIAANTTYVMSYFAPNGRYPADAGYFTGAGVNTGPLHLLADGVDGPNGVYAPGSATTPAYPTLSFNATNYWVDVVFATPPPNQPPLIVNPTAVANPTNAVITWITDTAATSRIDYGTSPSALNTTVSDGTAVTSHSVTLAALNPATTYYFRISTTNAFGTTSWPVTSSAPASFTTPKFSIWSLSTTPAIIDEKDGSAVEVGVKFRSDISGFATGVRFYKAPANTGVHVGHLWTSAGTLLTSVTFTNETASGWQEASFSTPVSIASNTTYVVSYYAPAGHYSGTPSGLNTAVDNPPLHALANGVDGPNGVYHYGPSGFPTSSFNAENYWVDLTFNFTGVAAGPPPVISGVIATPSTFSATLTWTTDTLSDSRVDYGTSASSLTLNAMDTSLVTSHSVTLTGLTRGTTYYYRVTSTNSNGSTTSPISTSPPASFVTPINQICPCSIWDVTATPAVIDSNDGAAVEVGLKFRSDVAGYVTGVRFYKAAANTGAHIGHLWTSGGTLLATATFTSETSSGWQQASFPTPVVISPGTTYVISYYAPTGHYSTTASAFATAGVDNVPLHALANGVDGTNGIYIYGASAFPTQSFSSTNYWVDIALSTTAPGGFAAPVITGVTANATRVAATITWNTDVAADSRVDYGTSAGALNLSVSSPTLVNAHSLSLTGLTPGTTYFYRVTSSEFAGSTTSPVTANAPATFTTPITQTCPCSIWPLTAAPQTPDSADGGAVEIGIKFRSDNAGNITGMRFYKSAANTGVHVGHLWAADGTLLATVTFTNETASGWQQATFSAPVAIVAGTTYVISYYAPFGHYAADGGAFSSAGVDNPPLHALQDGFDGPNGLYIYAAGGGFPTHTFGSTNYWVDVILQ